MNTETNIRILMLTLPVSLIQKWHWRSQKYSPKCIRSKSTLLANKLTSYLVALEQRRWLKSPKVLVWVLLTLEVRYYASCAWFDEFCDIPNVRHTSTDQMISLWSIPHEKFWTFHKSKVSTHVHSAHLVVIVYTRNSAQYYSYKILPSWDNQNNHVSDLIYAMFYFVAKNIVHHCTLRRWTPFWILITPPFFSWQRWIVLWCWSSAISSVRQIQHANRAHPRCQVHTVSGDLWFPDQVS